MTDTPANLAILIQVYAGDLECAKLAIQSFHRYTPQHTKHLYIYDDASPNQAGQQLADAARDLGWQAQATRSDRSFGFHGGMLRTTELLRIARQNNDHQLFIKTDPDILYTHQRLGHTISSIISEQIDLGGIYATLRPKDQLALLLDALPVGLRRRQIDDIMKHDIGARFTPLPWARDFLKAATRAQRIQFAGGAFIAMSPRFVHHLHERQLLPTKQSRTGLLFGEDILLSMIAQAGPWKTRNYPDLGNLAAGASLSAQSIITNNLACIHPLKDSATMKTLYDELLALTPS